VVFEGAPEVPGQPRGKRGAPPPAYVTDFLATFEGLALVQSLHAIK